MKTPDLIIFTDLDGTLLDHQSYQFAPALPALNKIKQQQIPLILVSSKTASEMEVLRKTLQNTHPFIVENGGAVFIPESYFGVDFHYQRKEAKYLILELGLPYPEIRACLNKIKAKTGLPIVGFGDLSVAEIVQLTGLIKNEAKLAKQRRYNEPFVVQDKRKKSRLEELLPICRELGLNLTRGNRFYHLMGKNDKGLAVRKLRHIYAKAWNAPFKTIGVGDSWNDFPMLQEVDLPVLVRNASDEYEPQILMEMQPILADGMGPQGWNQAILQLI
ncbi:MAG: HAD-IIB family hydrolase [bacterium]